MYSKFIYVLVFCSIINNIYAKSSLFKRQTTDRVCPTVNICGDGVCLVTTHPSFQYQYVCQCKDGSYRFEPCTSTVVNTCASSPCAPYACIETTSSPTGYLCQCGPSDLRPSSCPQVDWCASLPCRNGGVCSNLATSYRCTCATGYTGTNCETATLAGPCSSRPCGGFPCFESPNFPFGYVCQCATNDFRVDNCNSITVPATTTTTTTTTTTPSSSILLCPDQSICTNQGICYIIANTIRCVCPQGYTGNRCEISTAITTTLAPIQGCSPNPCRNSGSCITFDTGAFRGCICPTGFTGIFCEVASTATQCSQIQCLNGGVCQIGVNGIASCICQSGYTGASCEIAPYACTQNGRFKDPVGCAQGKYVECVFVGATNVGLPNGIAYVRDCPSTLRYNPTTDQCDYAINVIC